MSNDMAKEGKAESKMGTAMTHAVQFLFLVRLGLKGNQ